MTDTGRTVMNKHEDIITYDVYELDLYRLRQKLEMLNVKEAVVYGIGNNGYDTYRMFKNLGINICYFVDVKAMNGVRKCNGIEVKTPDEFADSYKDEYVVISPACMTLFITGCWGRISLRTKSFYHFIRQNALP